MNKGKIVQVVGPVVDVEFTEKLPGIYHALTVEYKVHDQAFQVTLEVQLHLADNWVRTVSMSGTEGLKRGYEVDWFCIEGSGPKPDNFVVLSYFSLSIC